MVIPPAEFSIGASCLRDAHVGAYGSQSGVLDDEAANSWDILLQRPRLLRPLLHASIHTHPLGQPAADDVREENSAPPQRTTAMHMTMPLFCPTINIHPLEQPAYDVGEERSAARPRLLRPLLRASIHTHLLGQPAADDVREENSAPRQRTTAMHMTTPLFRPTINIHPLEQPAYDVGEERSTAGWWLDDIPTAEGGTFMYGNAGGGSSVPVPSRAGTYVYLPPGSEVYMAAGGARGGGPIQPLLQSYNPVGALGTRAPQSSQDGVAGHWALAVTDDFPTGDGEAPYLGWGALTVTDIFPPRDGGTPYLARGALTVTDVFPEIDGGTPHLARGALIPSVGDRGGANARNEHVIDMPPPLPNGTTGTTDQARKFLERLLFGLLPACVVALGPLSGAPDGTKLATFIIMAVLIVLLVVGISTRACAEHVVRLAACAGIFAMTVLVSIQFSHGIYVAVAALVGVALSAITLAV